jgi:hypothetical protein
MLRPRNGFLTTLEQFFTILRAMWKVGGFAWIPEEATMLTLNEGFANPGQGNRDSIQWI